MYATASSADTSRKKLSVSSAVDREGRSKSTTTGCGRFAVVMWNVCVLCNVSCCSSSGSITRICAIPDTGVCNTNTV